MRFFYHIHDFLNKKKKINKIIYFKKLFLVQKILSLKNKTQVCRKKLKFSSKKSIQINVF